MYGLKPVPFTQFQVSGQVVRGTSGNVTPFSRLCSRSEKFCSSVVLDAIVVSMLDSRLLSRRWKAHTAWVFHFVRSLRTRQRSILRPLAALLVITSFFAAHAADNPPWLVQTRANYTLHYSAADQTQVAEYESFLAKGIAANEAFFGSTYPKQFDIYIYQDRASFDTGFQKNFISRTSNRRVGRKPSASLMASIFCRLCDGMLKPAQEDIRPMRTKRSHKCLSPMS